MKQSWQSFIPHCSFVVFKLINNASSSSKENHDRDSVKICDLITQTPSSSSKMPGFNFANCPSFVCITAMINHVLISFSEVETYYLSYSHLYYLLSVCNCGQTRSFVFHILRIKWFLKKLRNHWRTVKCRMFVLEDIARLLEIQTFTCCCNFFVFFCNSP